MVNDQSGPSVAEPTNRKVTSATMAISSQKHLSSRRITFAKARMGLTTTRVAVSLVLANVLMSWAATALQLRHVSLSSPRPSRKYNVNIHTPVPAISTSHQSASSVSRLYSSTDGGDDDDDDFMKALQSRIQTVSDRETKLPIVIVDTMLPRQTLKIEVGPEDQLFHKLVKNLIQDERPYFGMVGYARLNTGQTLPLQNGVQVQIIGKPQVVGSNNPNEESMDDDESSQNALRVELKATDRFRITGELDTHPGGWTEARVRFLDSSDEEAEEEDGDNPLGLARAMSRARELTAPNAQMPDGASLVDRWIALAKENERAPGQIDALLKDIGPMPDDDEPSERAFWIGALINPLPGLGQAMEIRPQLLMARTAEERVNVALEGILGSIRHMDGTQRLF